MGPRRSPASTRPRSHQARSIEGSLSTADRHLREGGWAAISQTIATRRPPAPRRALHPAHPTGNAQLAPRGDDRQLRLAIRRDRHERERPRQAMEQRHRHPARRHAQATAPRSSKANAPSNKRSQRLSSNGPDRRRTALRSQRGTGKHPLAAERHHDHRADRHDRVRHRADDRRDLADDEPDWTRCISIGMSFAQFARLIFYESGSVLIAGCLIGIAAGIAGAIPHRRLAAPHYRRLSPLHARVATRPAHHRDRSRNLARSPR